MINKNRNNCRWSEWTERAISTCGGALCARAMINDPKILLQSGSQWDFYSLVCILYVYNERNAFLWVGSNYYYFGRSLFLFFFYQWSCFPYLPCIKLPTDERDYWKKKREGISRRIVFDWPHATHMDRRCCPM